MQYICTCVNFPRSAFCAAGKFSLGIPIAMHRALQSYVLAGDFDLLSAPLEIS